MRDVLLQGMYEITVFSTGSSEKPGYCESEPIYGSSG